MPPAPYPVPDDLAEWWEKLGGNKTDLSTHYSVSRNTLDKWCRTLGLDLELAGISVNANGGVSRRYTPSAVEPIPFIAPPTIDGNVWVTPRRPKPSKTKSRGWAIFNDLHCPEHEPDLLAAACAWLADEQPSDGVLNGDIVNFDAVSRHRANPYKAVETINDCLRSACTVLHSIVSASPKTRWRMSAGNHENRLPDFIIDKAPQLWGVRPGGDDEFLAWHDLRNLLLLDKFGIELHDDPYPDAEFPITPKFVATHGDHVRAKSGNSAHAALDKSDHSFAQGHDHRLAQVFRTKWGADRKPSIHVGVQTGFMAKMDATGLGYAKKPDWQQGFGYVTAWPDGLFSAQLGVFVEGTLLIGGKRY